MLRSTGPAFLLLFAALFTVPLRAETRVDLANRAERYIRAGDAATAFALLSQAAALEPVTAESEDRIGFLLAVINHQTEAVERFEKAISTNPGYAPAHYHLGVALWLKEDPNRSIPHLIEAVRLAPEVFDYRLRLGTAFLDTSHAPEAVSELRKAV